ncbi:hypothetical protein CF15_03410 [Pyrodictium occultum]|uniref:Uncharacterized protein n=1 Tax=Pyrodictium occultum TaxID=2309 RepID=A0A0V8RUX6_PYROC|nr:hypothetical protein [Pyrodictium occultum]KSW11861.1 hypothetical protein CF15_03410 [Pyrodictium occultum]
MSLLALALAGGVLGLAYAFIRRAEPERALKYIVAGAIGLPLVCVTASILVKIIVFLIAVAVIAAILYIIYVFLAERGLEGHGFRRP